MHCRESGVRRGRLRWTPFVISVCCAPCAPHTRIQCLRRERTFEASVSSCSQPSVRPAALDSAIRRPLATRPPSPPPMSRLRGSHEACWLLSQGHSPLIMGGPSAHRPTVHDRSATVVPAFLVPSTHCAHLLSVPPPPVPDQGPGCSRSTLILITPFPPTTTHLSPTRPATSPSVVHILHASAVVVVATHSHHLALSSRTQFQFPRRQSTATSTVLQNHLALSYRAPSPPDNRYPTLSPLSHRKADRVAHSSTNLPPTTAFHRSVWHRVYRV